MEFRETLIAAQRNQQQKSSVDNMYYKARFDPPKKEQKARDKLSANIQKFLAKKEEEERQKKVEAQKKRDDLLALRDPKALRKIQKTLKVIKSANKSVLADAIDNDHTAVTLEGPDQPDQDDYGYESQAAAAIYEKMMQKYSKLPDEPKFAAGKNSSIKDINGTRERVKHALRHADDPVPHKRRRKCKDEDRESSPPDKYEPEKKKDEKSEKPKIRKPAPPPMDFNQLLKLAEQKKSEPIEIAAKKVASESEPERPMTKKQKREYEEEMARRQRRQERIDAEKLGVRKGPKEEKTIINKEKKPESILNGRIPKLSDRNNANKVDRPSEPSKTYEKEKYRQVDREKIQKIQSEKDKIKTEKERIDKERLDRLKAERDRIDREMERLNKDREKLDKTKAKLESSRVLDKSRPDKIVDRSKLVSKESAMKNGMDYKSQNAYRIDKNTNDGKPLSHKSDHKLTNGHTSQKPVPKLNRELDNRNGIKDKMLQSKQRASLGESSQKVNGISKSDPKRVEANKGLLQKRLEEKKPLSSGQKPLPSSSKPISNSFDFDKHVNSLGKNGTKPFPPGNVKRKIHPNDIRRKPMRAVNSDSEYDSEMDDFIDDRDENMDYSRHIKEIFGYDKSKYRDLDDDDDPDMESSFARQQREEYISKKIGIMEDLEDMRMEAMEKNKKKKRRRISDD